MLVKSAFFTLPRSDARYRVWKEFKRITRVSSLGYTDRGPEARLTVIDAPIIVDGCLIGFFGDLLMLDLDYPGFHMAFGLILDP